MTPSTCGECGSPLMLVAEKAFCTKPGCSMRRRDAAIPPTYEGQSFDEFVDAHVAQHGYRREDRLC